MRARLGGFKTRLEASLARTGLFLPWWLAASANAFGTGFALVAVGQRATLLPPLALVLALLLSLSSALLYAVTGKIAQPWLKSITVLSSAAILLSAPVVPDFAPVALIVLAAEMAVMATPRQAMIITGGCLVVLAASGTLVHLVGVSIYMVSVLLALIGGFMLRWYTRALGAERDRQDAVREQAMLFERQRIAREVHDVVGHSLSITLLHMTGARRALQQDRDVDEAIDALIEAERVGRTAMADIRRTVGLLANAPSGTRPLAGIDDIAALVERTRAAGLDVRYEQHGDLASVGATAGLGLYRIAQESLANIAKHAPAATAHLCLRIDQNGTRLTVRNGLPPGTPGTAASGSGLAGMSDRATQLGAELRAGPRGEDWVVDLTVPAAS